MQLKRQIIFIIQSTAFGLAAAFVFLWVTSDSFSGFASGQTASYHDAVASTAPSVVNVYASKIYQTQVHPLFNDPLFRRFFGEPPATGNKRTDNSIGSGVIMTESGYILTNSHVIQNANEIRVTLNDGRQVAANLIGMDTDTDLAVLHIQLDNLPSIKIGNSSKLKVGDVVLAIGNPYDFGQTVTQGIVSATSRKRRGISYFDDFIQTDADINLGNSGGALVTAKGELIGINTAIVSSSGGSEGIGLATPINQAVDVMRQLVENGTVVRGWLGIEAQTLGQDVVEAANLKEGGVLVTAVMRNGPADAAGMIPGDILISIDGKQLHSPDQAIETITELKPGNEVKIKLLRGWMEQELIAKVAQRPSISMPQ